MSSLSGEYLARNTLFFAVSCSPEKVLDQRVQHNTTISAKQTICKENFLRGSSNISAYDGPMAPQLGAPLCAYFHVSPDSDTIIYPFSSFPRHIKPGTPTKIFLLDLKLLTELLSNKDSTKLYHLATTPSQFGRWNRRAYQTHVVVASKEYFQFYDNQTNIVELNPIDNQIFYRDIVSGGAVSEDVFFLKD